MAAVELNLKPKDKQLRQFGYIGLAALPFLGWLYAGKPSLDMANWETWQTTRLAIFAGVAMLMGGLGFARPSWLKWPFIVASVITFPIGFVLGEVTMILIYLIAFVPVAMLFRLIGRDALDRDLDESRESYWEPKAQPKDSASYFRQS